ncbi:MAG: helix-turn-helix domain-containing protein [Alicyclobacillus sp.]|nr:helix-turn-helix domain-containing protein [Alicyclobacillus sp.]
MADIVVQFRGTVYENGYGQIAQKVMRDKRIHAVAKAIYAYLVSFAGQDGEAFPSVELMMDELGIKSRDTFYKYRKQLVEAGYITIEEQQRVKGQFYNNVYNIETIIDPDKVGDQPRSKKSTTVTSTTKKSTSINSTTINNSLSQISTLKHEQPSTTENVAVVVESNHSSMSPEVEQVKIAIENRLGTSIRGLLPMLNKWIRQYGAETLISKAEYIASQRGKWQNIVGAYRSAVVNEWDCEFMTAAFEQMAATSESSHAIQRPVRDERYAAFWALFPDV